MKFEIIKKNKNIKIIKYKILKKDLYFLYLYNNQILFLDKYIRKIRLKWFLIKSVSIFYKDLYTLIIYKKWYNPYLKIRYNNFYKEKKWI